MQFSRMHVSDSTWRVSQQDYETRSQQLLGWPTVASLTPQPTSGDVSLSVGGSGPQW